MLVISIELLSGVYVATSYNDREQAEWPPHPARLFSALVATWATHEPTSEEGLAELTAMRWLETLPAPEVLASSRNLTARRSVVPVFVPVNDVSLVTAPDSLQLAKARAAHASAEGIARDRLAEDVAKLEKKLCADTMKAIAPPARPTKNFASDVDALLLDRRAKQPRTFPAVVPEHPDFAFVWPDANASPEVQLALQRLLGRLVRLGHSSTLVRGWLADEAFAGVLARAVATHVEDVEDGTITLRWVGPGQVDRLEAAFAVHRETEPRTLHSRFVRYREGRRPSTRPCPRTVFSNEMIVFGRVDGPRLPITSGPGIARQFRRALMSVAGTPTPTMISGHTAEGGPADRPHLAIVPLPAVLGPHADGSLLGIGLVLPRDTSDDERRTTLRAIGMLEAANQEPSSDDVRPIRLVLGESSDLLLQRDVWSEERRLTLRSATWVTPARRWASATPIALDKNPGDLHHHDAVMRARAFTAAATSLREAIERVGLPQPIELDVVRSCVLPGTAKPRQYPRFPSDPKRPQRVLVHARLIFSEPVRGPLLLGAGRYHGLGLFLPIVDGQPQ